jgi:hypothetical protein
MKLRTFNQVLKCSNKKDDTTSRESLRNNYIEKKKLAKSIVSMKRELSSVVLESNECNPWRSGSMSKKCIMYWDKIEYLSTELLDMEIALYHYENECISSLYYDKKVTKHDM